VPEASKSVQKKQRSPADKELFSTLNNMHPRLKKKLKKSWAQVFYDHVFSRLTTPVFITFCA
jgi:hypothetical protein